MSNLIKASATSRAPFRTRRKTPTMLTGALAVAWLGNEQPALLAVVRQQLLSRPNGALQVEAASQLLAQFLLQVGRQQALPVIAAADVEQALLRLPDAVDPTIGQWIAAADQGVHTTPLATRVAGATAADIAQLMQAVVGILLDPMTAVKSA